MDKIDNVIESVIQKKISEPYEYEQAILTAFNAKKEDRKHPTYNLIKLVSTVCVCMVVIAGGVFAKNIVSTVKNFFAHNEGMDRAIENGYIEKPNMNYIESNNINVKVDNILMDDNNLSLEFSVRLDTEDKAINIIRENFENLILFDEEYRILYCQNELVFNNFCDKHNLNYIYQEYQEKYINSGVNNFIKSNVEEYGIVKLVYNFYASNYPKSKRIYINFDKINIETKENKLIETSGEWNLEIDMPEKFYNRSSVIYRVKETTNDTIKVSEAIVYDTCMKIEIYTQEEPTYDENEPEEIKKQKRHEKVEQWMEEEDKRIEEGGYENAKIFHENTYIKNQKGESFYPTNSNFGDSEIIREYTGNVIYRQTFSITKNDLTNEINLYIKYKGEDIYITLVRQ